MKVALIPPLPLLNTFGHGDFHLLLDQLVNRKAYREHYLVEKRNGAFLLLDNGAHEMKAGAASANLLFHAYQLQADEVAVPDVLWKAMATLERTTSALDHWAANPDLHDLFEKFTPRVMLVPQGEDYQAYKSCLFGEMMKWHRMHRAHPEMFKEPPTIGVSKDYEVWEGGVAKILRDDIQPLVQSEAVQVHLLGWGRQLYQLNSMAQEFPFIRSTDSAKPFVFASKGIMLDPEHEPEPEYPTRDKTYFDWTLTPHQVSVAEHNCSVFRKMAQGRYTIPEQAVGTSSNL